MAARKRSASPARKKRSKSKSRTASKSRSKTWLIHDNGGRPFKVVLSNSRALVYNNEEDGGTGQLLLDLKISKHFVGKSPYNRMTAFSGGHGLRFDGNSLLVKPRGSSKWVFIGWNIIEFQPLSEIVEFVSPVGNSDVPYPYAVDTEGRYYLLIDSTILTKNLQSNELQSDPYGYFYAQNEIAPGSEHDCKQSSFKNIEKYWWGNQRVILRWQPHRKKIEKKQYLKYSDQRKRVLVSNEEMVKLNRQFGISRGFRKLKQKTMVERRW